MPSVFDASFGFFVLIALESVSAAQMVRNLVGEPKDRGQGLRIDCSLECNIGVGIRSNILFLRLPYLIMV